MQAASQGSRELTGGRGGGGGGRAGGGGSSATPQQITEDLKKSGINSVFYVSPNTGHEFQTWRRSLKELAPLMFR